MARRVEGSAIVTIEAEETHEEKSAPDENPAKEVSGRRKRQGKPNQ
jgi:hypothetical protein